MKAKFLLIVLLCAFSARAQVGINTTTPDAQLDIRSGNQAAPANTDGILIPKVDVFPAINPTAAQQGMLVYLTTAVGPKLPGFYYWDNPTVSWIGFGGAAVSDADWYEVGTSTAPDNISDDMFHLGRVGIGQNSPVYPLQIENTSYDNTIESTNSSAGAGTKIGFNNAMTGNGDGDVKGVQNVLSGSGNGIHYGNYNALGGAGSGLHYGVYSELSGAGTGYQTGIYSLVSNTNNIMQIGTNNVMTGTGSGGHVGTQNDILAGSGAHAGVFNNLSATGATFHRGVYNLLNGGGSGERIGVYSELSGSGTGTQSGTQNVLSNSNDAIHYGVRNNLSGSGLGSHYGTYNALSGSGDGLQCGTFNIFTNSGTAVNYGLYNQFSTTGTAARYGVYNLSAPIGSSGQYGIYTSIAGSGSGNHFGMLNNIANAGNGTHYGIQNTLSGTGTGPKFGISTTFTATGFGNQSGVSNLFTGAGGASIYGVNTTINNTNNNLQAGTYNLLTGTGTGNKYGLLTYILTTAGGTGYGVYAEVTKAGSFSGYFLGNFAIGTTTTNHYIMPPSRGTNGQIMQTDGAGNVSWINPTAITNTAWNINGNSGTAIATNFLGTTDAIPLAFRTANTERMRILATGNVVVNNAAPFAGDVFSAYASGTNYAINGYATGSGASGFFTSTGTGNALAGYVYGTASNAGDFWTSTGANTRSTEDIYNQTGIAPALIIATDAANAGADGIEIALVGAAAKRGIDMYIGATVTGIGAAIFHDGTNRALNVQQQNAGNTQPALFASSVGSARVINAQNTSTGNTQAIGFFQQGSTGTVTGLFGNTASVYGQSAGIRSGIFTASALVFSTNALQGVYTGVGNHDAAGVFGQAQPAANYGYGVVGLGNYFGVFANGNMGASGTKPFQIDHPSDPANKLLRHYSMESPEVLNMYRGNVKLDGNGEAVVILPAYFNLININFSYHLTAIGAPANLYVKEEVQGNQFKVAGGNPNQKVSWQVFAERNDPYLQQNPESKAVEIEKKAEDKGYYQQPALYGQPEEKGIFYRYKADPSKVKTETDATEAKSDSRTKRQEKKTVATTEETKK